MSPARRWSTDSAAKLLDTTARALIRQVRRGNNAGADGSFSLDGVTARPKGRGYEIFFDREWTERGAAVAWGSVERMASALDISRASLGKKLEPRRAGGKLRLLRLRIHGRSVVARRFGRLWKLRSPGIDFSRPGSVIAGPVAEPVNEAAASCAAKRAG